MADITEKKVIQVLDEDLNTNLLTRREQVRQFFTSNIVTRTISYMMGWHYLSGKPFKLSCQSDGSLRVAMTSSNVENNETKSGTAADAWSGTLSFGTMTNTLDVWAWDNALNIQRSVDGGVVWQDEIEIPANGSMSVDCQTNAIRVQNKTAGSNSRYQIVGWY